jgi:hypothetical protein
MKFRVKCDEENNPPEVIERNELRATIYITPYKWADDESYLIWHDPELRAMCKWVLNCYNEVELVRE